MLDKDYISAEERLTLPSIWDRLFCQTAWMALIITLIYVCLNEVTYV